MSLTTKSELFTRVYTFATQIQFLYWLYFQSMSLNGEILKRTWNTKKKESNWNLAGATWALICTLLRRITSCSNMTRATFVWVSILFTLISSAQLRMRARRHNNVHLHDEILLFDFHYIPFFIFSIF